MTVRICAAMLAMLVGTIGVAAQKLKPEDIVAKHLDSIATAEQRAATKTIMGIGDAVVTFVTQKNQTAVGRVVIASSAEKMFFGLNLNAVDYPQEKFGFDGKSAKVAYVRSTARSTLGNFLLSNKTVLEETLFGGSLTTSWALLGSLDSKGKVSGGGTKKIDGKDTYAIDYSPKGGSDVDITLYFDKQTFRHVRTEYKRISSAGIGLRPEQSSGFDETRIKLTEDFSDFRAVGGITLAHGYKITYLISGQNGTTEVRWDLSMTQFLINQKIDEKTFVIE